LGQGQVVLPGGTTARDLIAMTSGNKVLFSIDPASGNLLPGSRGRVVSQSASSILMEMDGLQPPPAPVSVRFKRIENPADVSPAFVEIRSVDVEGTVGPLAGTFVIAPPELRLARASDSELEIGGLIPREIDPDHADGSWVVAFRLPADYGDTPTADVRSLDPLMRPRPASQGGGASGYLAVPLGRRIDKGRYALFTTSHQEPFASFTTFEDHAGVTGKPLDIFASGHAQATSSVGPLLVQSPRYQDKGERRPVIHRAFTTAKIEGREGDEIVLKGPDKSPLFWEFTAGGNLLYGKQIKTEASTIYARGVDVASKEAAGTKDDPLLIGLPKDQTGRRFVVSYKVAATPDMAEAVTGQILIAQLTLNLTGSKPPPINPSELFSATSATKTNPAGFSTLGSEDSKLIRRIQSFYGAAPPLKDKKLDPPILYSRLPTDDLDFSGLTFRSIELKQISGKLARVVAPGVLFAKAEGFSSFDLVDYQSIAAHEDSHVDASFRLRQHLGLPSANPLEPDPNDLLKRDSFLELVIGLYPVFHKNTAGLKQQAEIATYIGHFDEVYAQAKSLEAAFTNNASWEVLAPSLKDLAERYFLILIAVGNNYFVGHYEVTRDGRNVMIDAEMAVVQFLQYGYDRLMSSTANIPIELRGRIGAGDVDLSLLKSFRTKHNEGIAPTKEEQALDVFMKVTASDLRIPRPKKQ
jgi:hypothetical protein